MIIANFYNSKEVITEALTQWDYGQVLRVQGLKLQTAQTFHFSNEDGDVATRIGYTEGDITDVRIPDDFLEKNSSITANIYKISGDSGQTVYTVKIPMKAERQPEEYNKPEQKEMFQEVIEKVEAAVDATLLSETKSKESELNAKESETKSKEYEEETAEMVKQFAETTATATEALDNQKTASIAAVEAEKDSSIVTIGTTKDSAVKAVNDTKTAAVNEVNTTKTDANKSVEDTKTAAVNTVNQTKETALNEVAQAAEGIVADREQIQTNAENISKLASDYSNSIKPTVSGTFVNITDSADAPIQDLKVYGNSTQDGTPTPEAPIDIVSVGDAGSVDITVCGKNILKSNAISITKGVGVNFKVNSDGSITINGTSPYAFWYPINIDDLNFPLGNYRLILMSDVKCDVRLYVHKNDFNVSSNVITYVVVNSNKVYIKSEKYQDNVNLLIPAGTFDCTVKVMIIREDETDLSYEPYKAQTITVPLSEPLRGIGDYKDVICEQDGQIGVLRNLTGFELNGDENIVVQDSSTTSPHSFRISKPGIKALDVRGIVSSHFKPAYSVYTLNAINVLWLDNIGISYDGVSSVNEFKNYLSNQYSLGTAVEVVAILTTPIFEPFPQEVQDQYKALKTYYGTTNIFNNGGSNNEVIYVADTKTYIDNKFTELQNAILSSGANI